MVTSSNKIENTNMDIKTNSLNSFNGVQFRHQKSVDLTKQNDNLCKILENKKSQPNDETKINRFSVKKVQLSKLKDDIVNLKDKIIENKIEVGKKDDIKVVSVTSINIKDTADNVDNKKKKDFFEKLDSPEPVNRSPDNRFFKFDEFIGRGAYKTVYKGLDTENSVPVAWCELHRDPFKEKERQRFKEEAAMLKQLSHPNIVGFLDYWEYTNGPRKIVLVTELMTSGTLKAYMQRFKTQDTSRKFKVIKNFSNQILKGLAYLHGRNPKVIHRDLKCDNVFVIGQSGQVKIGDLGLATVKTSSFVKSLVGTPHFMAPEMYSEQYDESVDVYAFGMCVLEMVTDEYPYQDCKPHEVYRKVIQGIKPDSFYKVDNEDLKEVIESCIQLKSTQRPTVKKLLNHSIFLDNSHGLKLDVLRDPVTKKIICENKSSITFRLKFDKSKRKFWDDSWDENEMIEFLFNVDKESPEEVIRELNQLGKTNEEDMRYLVQRIKDKCFSFNLEKAQPQEEVENSSSDSSPKNSLSENNKIEVPKIVEPFGRYKEESNVEKEKQLEERLNMNDSTAPITGVFYIEENKNTVETNKQKGTIEANSIKSIQTVPSVKKEEKTTEISNNQINSVPVSDKTLTCVKNHATSIDSNTESNTVKKVEESSTSVKEQKKQHINNLNQSDSTTVSSTSGKNLQELDQLLREVFKSSTQTSIDGKEIVKTKKENQVRQSSIEAQPILTSQPSNNNNTTFEKEQEQKEISDLVLSNQINSN